MSAHTRFVLLLLLICVGATSWMLFASHTRIAPEEMLLARWERAAKTVQNVQGTVKFYHYDSPWPDKQSEGRFWYTADHRGAFFHRPLPPDFTEDWTYLEWDDKQVKLVDNSRRTITVIECPLTNRTQVARNLRHQGADSSFCSRLASALTRLYLPSEYLPMVLPREGKFWADEFQWKYVPGQPSWITATSIIGINYPEQFDLILDPKTGLPLAVQHHEPSVNQRRDVLVVSDMKLNAKSLPDISPIFDESSPKWKTVRETVPQTAKVD